MTDENEDRSDGDCASPPCYMHEVDPVYMGLAKPALAHERSTVMRWRKTERERLLKERIEIPAETRLRHSEAIARTLERLIGDVAGLIISAYWPFRGEPDLRGLLERVSARGGRTALPVVIARGKPLVFRVWRSGDQLTRGIWGIPVPASDAQEVIPDVVIAPVVGFDSSCYRLGFGGGFFDRTLAALDKKPRILGVGYSQAAIATIHPQPHDIPMNLIVTESGVVSPA